MMTQITDPTSFEFTLLRRRLVTAGGEPIDSSNPAHWELEEALLDANAAPEVVHLGHGRLSVISTDDRAFVREKLLTEPEPSCQYIRACLLMDLGAERQPAMNDLVAVLLPGSVAVVYEVVVAASDLDLGQEPRGEVLVSLPPGHAVLRAGPDLPLVGTGEDEESPMISGGSHAVH